MKKVFIGVGHGGKDSGAVGKGGLLEKDLNLSIARSCGEVLKHHGVEVRLSRVKDENDPIDQEVRECNAFAPDLAVDIHNNAGGGNGAEVYYHYRGGISKLLADNILREIVNAGQNSRGTKTRVTSNGKDYYQFIRDTKAPAVIVECAFIDSTDVSIIDTPHEQEQMGVAIAKGILRQLGIEYKPDKVYRVQVGVYKVKANAIKMQQNLKSNGYDAVIYEGR